MMINANSIAQLREQFGQYRQADAAQTKLDFLTRNSATAEMQKDLEAGDLDGAKAAKDAAVQAQQSLVTDRANQSDLRQDLQEVHNHFRLRHDDLFHMKIALQNGDLSGAKQALDALGKVQADIRSDVQHIRDTNPAPSPIDVTA